MAAKDDLLVWASATVLDPILQTPNKLTIGGDLWLNGWLRTNPVNGQHLNQLLNLMTDAIKNETLTPSLNLSDLTNAETARTNLGIDLSLYNVKSNNLSDVVDPAAARDNLGLNTDTLFNTFFDSVYPVGTVYENKTNATNPGTLLGRGTWVAEGEGRVAIGAGTGTDINAVMQSFTAGTTGGEYVHTLTVAELPPHTHSTAFETVENDAGTAGTNLNASQTPAEFSATTSSVGSGTAHNNVQPYAVYYRWLRTA